MREPLESHSEGTYDRPQSNWSCGHADGSECLLGPAHLGVCQASAHCAPRKDGDRWICNRPVTRGGTCDDGPLEDGSCRCVTQKCSPVRTMRSKRGVFVLSCLALTLGGIMVALNSPVRRDFLAPGPLTKQHSQIITGAEDASRCSSCHPAGNGTTSQWMLHAIGLNPGYSVAEVDSAHAASTQTELCMKCHAKSIDETSARLAHNVPKQILEAITRDSPKSKNNSGLQLVSFSAPANQNGELACAACHREHHGAEHSLTALTNAQCQNCHSQQFKSFEHGHPEFESWPYTRRQRIAFDHVSHSAKHFNKESREFKCQDCHQKDGQNEVLSVTSYDACNDCHERKLNLSMEEGVTILQLPRIDTEVLLDAGFDIGQWPVHASGEFDGTLPVIMNLLLAADEKGRAALEELGSDFDFYDVDTEDEEQLEVVADLVWSVKRLLSDLVKDTDATWRGRMREVLGTDLSPASLDHLHTAFSNAAFKLSADKWFLDLHEDVRLELGDNDDLQIDESIAIPVHYPSFNVSASQGNSAASGRKQAWQIDEENYAVTYFPSGHNDAFMALLVDLLAKRSAHATDPVVEDCWYKFGQSNSIGQCITCHSVDANESVLQVNWRARHDQPTGMGFTKFSHSQHLIQPTLSDCSHCHKMNPTTSLATSYETDSLDTVSSFHPLLKGSCVECHNNASQKDNCTTCHSYHVNPQSPHSVKPLVPTTTPLVAGDGPLDTRR